MSVSLVENQARKKSIAITSVVAALVVACMFIFGLTYTDPPIHNAIAIDFQEDPAEITKEEHQEIVKEQKVIEETKKLTEKASSGGRAALKDPGTPNSVPSMKGSKEKLVSDDNSNVHTAKNPKTKPKAIGTPNGTSPKPTYNSNPRNSSLIIKRGSGGRGGSNGIGTSNGTLNGDPNGEGQGGRGNGAGIGNSIGKGTRKILRNASINLDDCPNTEYGAVFVKFQVDANGKCTVLDYSARGSKVVNLNSCAKAKINSYFSQLLYEKGSKEVSTKQFNIHP